MVKQKRWADQLKKLIDEMWEKDEEIIEREKQREQAKDEEQKEENRTGPQPTESKPKMRRTVTLSKDKLKGLKQ